MSVWAPPGGAGYDRVPRPLSLAGIPPFEGLVECCPVRREPVLIFSGAGNATR